MRYIHHIKIVNHYCLFFKSCKWVSEVYFSYISNESRYCIFQFGEMDEYIITDSFKTFNPICILLYAYRNSFVYPKLSKKNLG